MINVISLSVFAVTIIALIGRFLAEPPAGWPSREISVSVPPQRNVMLSTSGIKSNPVAYAQARSVETLTKTITATNSDKTILNFNDGTSPFGLKKNAEIWNGRIAMVRLFDFEKEAANKNTFYRIGFAQISVRISFFILFSPSYVSLLDCFYLGFRARIFSAGGIFFRDATIGWNCHDIILVCHDRNVWFYRRFIIHGRRRWICGASCWY